MVDFESNAAVFRKLGLVVIAASVDPIEHTGPLVDALRIRFVNVLSELNGSAVADATGAWLEVGDRTHLQPTAFLLDPAGLIVNSVYSSGPIGRFEAGDVIKKVVAEQVKAGG